MTEEQQQHPLNGVKLDALLTELVDHYDWEILAEQININCFKSYPSIKSSVKFLRKTTWARERVEAFYLYKFKHYPRPSDEQHKLQPRNRLMGEPLEDFPAVINLGDREFFDDPISGPVFPSKKTVEGTRKRAKKVSQNKKSDTSPEGKVDPWAKWRD